MLTVYRASAGSGKTHLLTGTYLRMLFKESTSFDNILAVTFTNKAMEEMKQRILSQLFILSSDPDSSDYIKPLEEEFCLSKKEIRTKARRILIDILHNYSGFNVSTIDHFFQNTTRAFTREIGLQGGYNIELDQNRILTEAIDRLIASLDDPANKQLLKWLELFSKEKVENASDWNIRKDLLELSTEIFKEEYKRNSNEILNFTANKNNLTSYIAEIKEIKNNYESLIKETANKACALMKQNGLTPTDFSGKNRSPFNAFINWQQGNIKDPTDSFLKLKNDISQWYTAKTDKNIQQKINDAYTQGLNDCVVSITVIFDTIKAYRSATESLRFIYTVGILSDIDRNIREYSRENNLMLISDTTELLNQIIDGKDTPFLYEKIGTRLKHFMIDEFQDTSGMQWENFQPLVKESLSNDFDNLIVGDVKQSIYRWRSSDWNLLHHELRSFETEQRQDKVLDTNWRSCANIVTFNNAFFTAAAKILQDKYNEGLTPNQQVNTIVAAYDDICQKVAPSKRKQEGHVRVEFIEADRSNDWKDKVLEKLPQTIIKLQDNGYSLKDIAILVRTANEGANVAKTLLEYKNQHSDTSHQFDVISNDSLFIAQAKVVQTIISFMRYLLNPDSALYQLLASFHIDVNLKGIEAEKAIAKYFNHEGTTTFNPFGEESDSLIEGLRKLPLFEMTEQIIRLVVPKRNTSDKVFVQAFQDLVLEFISSNTADLSAFLDWWDETGVRKTISTPDSQDAIRILTIHKSKGLGFRAVIIPFASWGIDNDSYKTNIIWCHPRIEPFNKLPLLPLKYGKTLLNTIYAEDYLHEKLQVYIDNLNIAYVAFTRAKEELIIFAPGPKKTDRTNKSSKSGNTNNIGGVLMEVINNEEISQTEEMMNLKSHINTSNDVFEAGNWWHPKEEKENDVQEIKMRYYPSTDPGKRLQLRLHGKGYFHEKEERLYGTLMHDILSEISYPDDICEAVASHVRMGSLRQEQAQPLIERIRQLISAPDIAPWFDKKAQVLNETDILIADGTSLRPDRVILHTEADGSKHITIIDYKFGKIERRSYLQQVSQYMDQLRQMGYTNVEGFIWYVELQKRVAVTDITDTRQMGRQLSLF